jgi:hypothetical protein
MVRVWARYSDRMRGKPIIAFIVSDPRVKEEHSMISERRGGTGHCPTGRTFCVGLTLKRHLKGCRDDEVFFKLSSTPECHALRGHTAFGS